MMTIVYGALEPVLSLRILDYNVTDSQTGLIFGVEPLTYALSTIIIPYIVPKWVEARVTLITALVLLGVSTALVGPFFEEKNMVVMLIGLGLSGFMMGFLIIPNMPEMMKATKEAHPNCDLDHANSLLSGMLNAGFGIGQAVGPLLGAYLYQATNFRMAMNIIAIICIGYAFLYLVCAKGCQAYLLTCKNFSNRNRRQSAVD